MNALSSRELALAIWGALLLAFLLSKRSIRGSLLGVAKAALASKLIALFVAVVLYNAAVILCLRAGGVWDSALLKDTVVWFVFAGVTLVFRSTAVAEDDQLFLRILKETVRLVVVVEFVRNTYTLPLAAELFVVPLASLLAMADVLARRDPKHSGVAGAIRVLQATGGLAILGIAVSKAVGDFGTLWSSDSLRRMLLPPTLSVSLIPLVYAVALYAVYDQLFSRLVVALDSDGAVARYARKCIRASCGVSLGRARAMLRERAHDLMLIRSREDVDKLFGELAGN